MQFDYENLLLCLACLQLLIVFARLSAIASYKPVFKKKGYLRQQEIRTIFNENFIEKKRKSNEIKTSSNFRNCRVCAFLIVLVNQNGCAILVFLSFSKVRIVSKAQWFLFSAILLHFFPPSPQLFFKKNVKIFKNEEENE